LLGWITAHSWLKTAVMRACQAYVLTAESGAVNKVTIAREIRSATISYHVHMMPKPVCNAVDHLQSAAQSTMGVIAELWMHQIAPK